MAFVKRGHRHLGDGPTYADSLVHAITNPVEAYEIFRFQSIWPSDEQRAQAQTEFWVGASVLGAIGLLFAFGGGR